MNFDDKRTVLETSICKCGQEYDSKVRYSVLGMIKEHELDKCDNCYEKERKAEAEARDFDNRHRRFTRDFHIHSLVNPKLEQATFDSYDPTTNELTKAKMVCQKYADKFNKENPVSLLLIGNYGTGKSHLAVSIAKEVIDKHARSSLFMPTPKLLTKLRSTYNKGSHQTEDQIIKDLSEVDLLVIDDLGAEQTKTNHDTNEQSWATSKIFEIIDNRIGRHTIFTTNYDVKELQTRIGGRNFSRMMENTHVVKMYGDDYRLRNFK